MIAVPWVLSSPEESKSDDAAGDADRCLSDGLGDYTRFPSKSVYNNARSFNNPWSVGGKERDKGTNLLLWGVCGRIRSNAGLAC